MSLLKTPFHAAHKSLGAKMIDFGGWDMPVQYAGIRQEHLVVRESVGVFDVSHMGEVRVTGPKAADALDALVTNVVHDIEIGGSQYAAMTNDQGGIVDDLFLYRLGEQDYLVCVNASNQDKDFAWMLERNPFPGQAHFENQSPQWAQLAVQGPRGVELTNRLSDQDLLDLPRGRIVSGSFAGVEGCWMARTGYTGEDGFEIFIPADRCEGSLERTLSEGADLGAEPCGLGARDTLRLEVKNLLYGNDIDEETTPLEACLKWITPLQRKGQFTGCEVLRAQAEAGLQRRLVGLVVQGRIPRKGSLILNAAGEKVGQITSGGLSYCTDRKVAMGYVQRGNGRPGTELKVEIRGRTAAAEVVRGPFYRRQA